MRIRRSKGSKASRYLSRSSKISKYMSCSKINPRCNHEKCHHFRAVKFLNYQRKTCGMNFHASLQPYHKVYKPKKFGIKKGATDFLITYNYECKVTGKRYCGIAIELKTGDNDLSPSQIKEIGLIIKHDKVLPAVCYGWKSIKKVVLGFKKNMHIDKLEKLCWSGKRKKESIKKNV